MKPWIVIAWLEDVREYGETFAADLGARPTFVARQVPKACTWLRSDRPEDLEKARAFVVREHPENGRVFQYPAAETDPLNRARAELRATIV